MAIGNNIKNLRIQKHLSQQIVADSLNVDRRTYAAWEQGTQDVKSGFIPELAKFFDVEIEDLFGNDKSINIEQTFNNSSINTAVLILTDKESINKVLDAIKQINH